jgi:hypothetical protein
VSEAARNTWDFFVSYAQEDRAWAEWIAWALEEDGYRVLIQAWDWVPGTNWVRGLQSGTRDAQRTIAVLSSAYLESVSATAEWRAAWASDPHGVNRRLIVLRVAECEGAGLLAAITGVDLFGVSEPEARERLREAISAAQAGRAKPATAPGFPGNDRKVPDEPRFPGSPERGGSGSEAGASAAPGLGQRVFSALIPRHSGKLSVAFGAGNTLVVAEQDTTVHRWSLRDNAPLPGASAGPAPKFSIRRADTGTQMAASTGTPTVAVSRGAHVRLLHFGDDGHRTSTIPLGNSEFLIAANGKRFATYDGRGVTVRDFATGAAVWQSGAPGNLAAVMVDGTGDIVAMAGAPNMLAGSNKVVVVVRDSPRPFDFSFANLPLVAGCNLGISPDGQLAACASFREIVVVRLRTGEIVRQRKLAGAGDDFRASLGTRPHRLVCSARGDLLWFRGRRVVHVNWLGERSRYLPQDGLCDDIAFDHATSRLAMVYESGQVDVFQWSFGG